MNSNQSSDRKSGQNREKSSQGGGNFKNDPDRAAREGRKGGRASHSPSTRSDR